MYWPDLTFNVVLKIPKFFTSELNVRLIFVFSNTVIGTIRCLMLRFAQSSVTLFNMVISPS